MVVLSSHEQFVQSTSNLSDRSFNRQLVRQFVRSTDHSVDNSFIKGFIRPENDQSSLSFNEHDRKSPSTNKLTTY